MKNFYFSLLPALFSILFFTNDFSSTEEPAVEKDPIEALSASQEVEEIKTYNLFELNETVAQKSDELKHAVYLDLSKKPLQEIYKDRPKELNIVLPTEEEDVTLNLRRHKIVTDNFQAFVKSSDGTKRKAKFNLGAFYTGTLEGEPNSVVTISVFENEVMGILSFGNQNYNLGKMRQGVKESNVPYVLFKERDMKNPPVHECQVPASESAALSTEIKGASTTAQKLGNVVKVYIECDFDMYKDNGSDEQATIDKTTAIFNEVATLYGNEQILTQISEIVVWDSTDPYPNSSSNAALDAFGAQVGNSFNGDLGHLISTASGNNGGLAWLDVLCANQRRTCYSNIANNFNSVPTFSWTVEVFTHEMGHNIGSPHTQSCKWGPSGNQALDDCYPTEGGCAPGPTPTNGGTIMSYCHLAAPKINFANGFGIEPGNLIRNKVANANCLEERFDCFSKIVLEPGVTYQGTTTDGAATEFEDYACSPVPHRGPEIAHVFSANVPGKAYLTYTENSPDQLDLFLNEVCEPSTCIKMWNGATLVQDSFDVVPGTEYVFLVDVVEDSDGGDYTLRISFPNAGCNTNVTLEEGVMYTGNTVNGTANALNYNCSSERYVGNEIGHIYTPTVDGTVYIYYNEDLPVQADLLLMDACDNTTCYQKWTGGQNIRDSIDVVAGKGYFFFVDIKEDNLGGVYNLLISSPGSGCTTTVALNNGETYNGNSADGAANFINYNCGSTGQSGNEVGHFFIHPEEARARVQFNDPTGAGFNLFLADACNPDSCLQMWSGNVDEEIPITALRNYFFIVDKATAGADAAYDLTVTIEAKENTCFCFDPTEPEICENFESYFGGDVSPQSDCWNVSTSTNDGLIDVGNAISGDNALKISDGRSTFFDLGNRNTGKYILKFKQNVTTGKEAFWRVYHTFDKNDPANNQVAFDVEMTQTGGIPFAKVYAGAPFGSSATFPYLPLWQEFVVIFDLDNSTAEFTYANITYHTWDFSNTRNGTDGNGILAGIEFYNNGPETEYLIDNVQFVDNSAKYCERSGAIFCDDFDDRAQGQQIVDPMGGFWNIMDRNGGVSYGNATTLNSKSGLLSAQLRAGNPGQPWDDIVCDFGTFDQGRIKFSYQLYVPTGNTAHGRTLHTYNQNDIDDEQVGSYIYFDRVGNGMVLVGGDVYPFDYTRDSWIEYVQIVDFENDESTIFVEGVSVVSFPFTNTVNGTGGTKRWAGFNFSTLSENSGAPDRFTWMFIDNVEMFDLDLYLSVDPEELYVDETAGSATISVESNTSEWEATTDEFWIDAPTSGNNPGSFDGTFDITWQANPSIESRGHDVLVTGRGVAPKIVRVIQFGALPFMDVSPNGIIDVPASAGAVSLDVTSNVFWNVLSSDTSWMRVNTVPGGTDDGTFEIGYDLNIGPERIDTIFVEGQPAADIFILIRQAAAGPTLVVQKDTICVDGLPGTVDFEVLANVAWDINNSNSWVGFSPDSGNDARDVTITYEENPTTSNRYADFTLTGSGVPEETVVLKQTPIPAFLEADPLNINLTKDGGSTTFDISSNVNWTAQETASWFTIDDTDRVDDSAVKTIDLVYEENIFPDERIDTIFISGDNGVADIIVIVRQEGAGRLLSASTISITLPPTAGDTFIDISSNIDWRARTLDAWYDLDGSDTRNGNFNERIMINYQENQTTGTRTGEIELTGSGVAAITILINQEAKGAFLDITPCDVQVDENAGSFDINVAGNVAWSLAPDQGWITTSTTSGSGSTTVTVSYLENGAPTTRTGQIEFTPVGAPGVAGKTVTINQTGAGFVFEVDQDTICVGPALTQVRTNVTAANFTWLVSDDAQWVALSPETGGFSNGSFMVQIFANPNGDTRYAHVTVETQDGSVKLPIVVKQTGANPVLDASPTMINVGDAAGTESFAVTGNVTWTAKSADAWIHTFSPESALGDSNVSFSFDGNPSTDPRTGTIEVCSPGVPSTFITVTQAGGAQTLSVMPQTINVTAPAGSSMFDIVASGDWTVTSNDAWLKATDPASAPGDRNVVFDYDENTDVNSRTGTYTLELTGTGLSETITVIQEGASSILNADPMVFNLPAGPNGSEMVTVTSNIDWSAVENSGGWLSLQTRSGTGGGSIPFNYLTNFDVNSRSAEITLSGNGASDKVIVVNQAGADVIFGVDNLTLSVNSLAGDVDLGIDANVDWEICAINDPWITGVTPTDGSGNGTLNIAYDQNTAPTGRTGTFKICNTFNSDEITVTVNQSAAGVTFGVDKTNISFGQPGGSEDVEITSNLDWTVKTTDTWISLTPADGSGDGTVTVSGSENLDFAPRTGTVTICSQGQPDLVITVMQEGRTRMISVNPTSITVDQPAGSDAFNITSNSDWTVKTDATWISLGTFMGSGNGTVDFDFPENPDLMQRTAIIKVCVTGLPDTEITVTQAGRSGILSVNPSSIMVGWEAGSTTFDITSNTDWTVKTTENWLFPNPFSGTGDATINVGYTENPDMTARTGVITICATGLPDQTVTITQGGAVAPELTANPTIINVPAAGGMPTFEITSNIDWVIDESETWLNTTPVSAGSTGTGNETITVGVSANIGAARSGIVTLTGAGVADVVISIEQAGVMSFMDVSTNMINLMTPAGSGDFTITSNVDWQISDDMSWFTINTTDGSGTETISYNYTENTDLMSRSGTITVEGLNGVADQIITVTQAGLSAMLDVSTLTINLPANAGNDGTFEITSNVLWNIMPGASWLNGWNTLSETGSETITFAYDSNPTSSMRTTTITVSGSGLEQIITVNQEGASQFIMVDPERINLTAPAGNSKFTIESNLDWTVTVPAAATWIKGSTFTGTRNGEFTFNYDENTGTNVRSTVATVSAPGVPDQTVEINQQGTVAAFLTLDQADVTSNNLSGSQAYNVSSNVDWEVTVDAPWVQLIPNDPTTGSGDGFFIAQWSSNTTSTARVATITVSGAGVPDVVVTITQDEFSAMLDANPDNFNVGAFQGSVQFDITSNITWSINSTATWIRNISNTFGSNNSTMAIIVDYQTNFNPGARTAEIEISGGGITKIVEITQDATTGAIDLEKLYGLSLYPNPVSSEFTVDFNLPSGENLTVDVLDVTGKMINRLSDDYFASGENQLIGNVAQLSPGMYLLRFKSEQGVLTKRFVVSK